MRVIRTEDEAFIKGFPEAQRESLNALAMIRFSWRNL